MRKINLLVLMLIIFFSFVATPRAWADNGEPPLVVTITCNVSEFCEPEMICTPCTAVTVQGETELDGTYTWELNGEAFTASVDGNFIEVCGEDLIGGINTLVATDTSNEDTQGYITLSCATHFHPCFFEHTARVLRSRWALLPAMLFFYKGCGYCPPGKVQFTPELSPLSVIPMFKLQNTRTEFILQYILIMPSIITGIGFDGSSEIVTVSIAGCGCRPTAFEIEMLPAILGE